MDKRTHQLYVCLYFKYDNNIIPELPRILVSYLLDHPEKISFYINKTIHVGMILYMLAIKYAENPNIDILEEIIQYVEVNKCMKI